MYPATSTLNTGSPWLLHVPASLCLEKTPSFRECAKNFLCEEREDWLTEDTAADPDARVTARPGVTTHLGLMLPCAP